MANEGQQETQRLNTVAQGPIRLLGIPYTLNIVHKCRKVHPNNYIINFSDNTVFLSLLYKNMDTFNK